MEVELEIRGRLDERRYELIKQRLERLDIVDRVSYNTLTHRYVVVHHEADHGESTIINSLKGIGYNAVTL